MRVSGTTALLTTVLLTVALFLTAGCGGGSGGGGSDPEPTPPPTPPAPLAEIVFPPSNSLTDGLQVTVTGVGDIFAGISALTVNGVDAVPFGLYKTWTADVPVTPGSNVLSVDVTKGLEVTPNVDSCRVRHLGPLFEDPSGVDWDATAGRLYVVDAVLAGLFRVDPVFGDRVPVSTSAIGSGPGFIRPVEVAVDVAGGVAYVADAGRGAVMATNLVTGDRTVVSDALTGTGPQASSPVDVAFSGGRLFVLDDNFPGLIEINPATGVRTLISGPGAGTGPAFATPRGLSIDPLAGQALIADFGADLVRVDLLTGNRVTLAAGFSEPRDVAVDALNNRALVLDFSTLVAVDLTSGVKSTISSPNTSSIGPDIASAFSLALDLAGDRVLCAGGGAGVPFSIGLLGGARTWLLGIYLGQGPNFQQPVASALDTAGKRSFVLDRILFSVEEATSNRSAFWNGEGPDAATRELLGMEPDLDNNRLLILERHVVSSASVGRIQAFGLATSTITEVSGPNRGTGPDLLRPVSLSRDPAGLQAFVADVDAQAIVTINLLNGNRTILSGPGVGVGPDFVTPTSVAYPGAGIYMYVVDQGIPALVRVNLVDGGREVLSGAAAGNGPALSSPVGITIDPVQFRALVTDPGLRAVVSIDLISGNRSILSGAGIGTGPRFRSPSGIRLEGATGIVWVVDSDRGLMAVEPVSGARVIHSR